MPSTHSRLISIRIKVFIRCRMVLVIFCFLQLYADLVNCVFDIWVCVFMLAWDHAKRTFKYFQQPFDGILQWHIVSVEFYIDLKVVENFIISLTCLVMEVLQCVWPRPRRVFLMCSLPWGMLIRGKQHFEYRDVFSSWIAWQRSQYWRLLLSKYFSLKIAFLSFCAFLYSCPLHFILCAHM